MGATQEEVEIARLQRQTHTLIDSICPVIYETDQKFSQKLREGWKQLKRQ